jgi:phage-related minor tail protein
MVEVSDVEALEVQLDALETSIGATTTVSAAFNEGLQNLQSGLMATEDSVKSVSRSMSTQLGNAFTDVVFEGGKLSDALKNVASSMIQTSLNSALKPVTDGLASTLSGGIGNILSGIMGFKDGGAFSSGRVSAFAKGGVVTGPTTFPMRGGTGLMGEAGPEAIMPLSRGPDGSLGVKSRSTSSNVTVNMNITSPDAGSFTRSRAQVAAGLSRALQRGQRNF